MIDFLKGSAGDGKVGGVSSSGDSGVAGSIDGDSNDAIAIVAVETGLIGDAAASTRISAIDLFGARI